MFAGDFAGVPYGQYCRDHRKLVAAQIKTADQFGFDFVSCISDPAREVADSKVVFENPDNAYPTRIIYRRDGAALVARIEGKRRGVDASEEWRFTRLVK